MPTTIVVTTRHALADGKGGTPQPRVAPGSPVPRIAAGFRLARPTASMPFTAPDSLDLRRAKAWLALATTVAIAGCGGGGGGAASSNPSIVASAEAQRCSANNPFRFDATAATTVGDLETEKRWLRTYMDAAYLWYRETPVVDASATAFSSDTAGGFYPSIDNYFLALKTPRITPSGRAKDEFSFTYPTRLWRQLSQSGIALGYGIEWTLQSATPPRNIRIAYVEPSSPADNAGLQRGDTLVSVNGVSADDGSDAGVAFLNAALFPTAVGTYGLNFSRAGSALPVQVLTAGYIVKQPVLQTQVLDVGGQRVGYIVFNDHVIPSEAQLIAAIETLAAASVSDLVLDLRYNGGGYLYIASELAYMIAGPARTAGKVFERLQYNDKRSGENISDPFRNVSCLANASFNCTSVQPLPTLDLGRVFVLTSGSTCSASESLINGLRGVDVDVRLIGGTTCGKPYGFTARDNCGISYFPIEFQGVNDKGFGDYADGFAAACSATDDLDQPLGSVTEGQLAAALHLRANGSCAPPVSVTATAAASPSRLMLRGPARENRIFAPQLR